jgi:hypothetical protein
LARTRALDFVLARDVVLLRADTRALRALRMFLRAADFWGAVAILLSSAVVPEFSRDP